MADTPLTLAETASVFGEMLTFRALLARETDPARRKVMLAAKVGDMLNTVVRQIAFVTFEQKVHDERREAELTPDRLAEVWLDVQRESLGPALQLDGVYRHYWSYIPHFIHTPFYVYAYAFGDCLVNSLYARYEDAHQGFAERYLEMLRAAVHCAIANCWLPLAIDAADPAFWSKGLSVVAGSSTSSRRWIGPNRPSEFPLARYLAGNNGKPVNDDNSLTGRVRRYAQVSGAMGGLAARLAGERYLGLTLDRERHAAELKAVLGGIKGPLMKVAQLPRHDPRRIAQGIRPGAGAAPSERAGDGLAVRQEAHGRRARPRLAEQISRLRSWRGAGGIIGPGAPGGGARRNPARLQTAVPRYGIGRRSRSAPA